MDRDPTTPPPAPDAPGLPGGFQNLMPFRVQDILLAASHYDAFTLQEDGQLGELILSQFLELNLRQTPGLTHVSSGAEALALAREQRRFNLIITTINLGDMDAAGLARAVKSAGLDVPVVVLAYDNRELNDFTARNPLTDLAGVFVWSGDARILLAIVKCVEDRRNVARDTRSPGVRAILVVEDSVRYYSAFLPVIYTELITQSQRLIREGVNLSQKIVRMKARPKILLCTTFEEAWTQFTAYREYLLGIISDIEFPRGGRLDRDAGFELAALVRHAAPDVPVLLQSSRSDYEARARAAGASFLLKGSPTLLTDLRHFMVEQFAFGDFVFRLPDGTEVDRATNLKSLELKLHTVPAESIAYHAARNHFSNWLIARTEFDLARSLRPRRVSDYPDHEALRRDLILAITGYRREQGAMQVSDFDPRTFDDPDHVFARLGGGSLGGKARGLAFVRQLLARENPDAGHPGVRVAVPPSVIVGTDVFDRFLEVNDLRDLAIQTGDDAEILRRFLAAPFPADIEAELRAYLATARYPLAVRSSSLLEDSQYRPFTGVYATYMIPNNHRSRTVRLEHLLAAIKRVYASTFSQHAKAYLKATPYRLEEEKMAVILQRVVGAPHHRRFYPDLAGVARSHNFYPVPPQTSADGVAAVGLGLGKTVVEGEKCLTFCPRYPRHLVQFSSVDDILANSQRSFWALKLDPDSTADPEETMREDRFDLDAAEADGTLNLLGSTYSEENHAVYDGLSRHGVRLVSFAAVLKHAGFPLADLLTRLLQLGSRGMNRPVEIEFAVRLSPVSGKPLEFGFLQIRPLVLSAESETLDLGEVDPSGLVCSSPKVLGNGQLRGIRDVVMVDFHRFDRSRSREAAREVGRFNAELQSQGLPYLLIGVGRWGSTDPWLGIPVAWDQISGARVIVEAGFRDTRVEPSQGSHFFQNLTAFQIGYFTVNAEIGEGFVDWEWLAGQPAESASGCVRHLRFAEPLLVKMDGHHNRGVIYKPGASEGAPA